MALASLPAQTLVAQVSAPIQASPASHAALLRGVLAQPSGVQASAVHKSWSSRSKAPVRVHVPATPTSFSVLALARHNPATTGLNAPELGPVRCRSSRSLRGDPANGG